MMKRLYLLCLLAVLLPAMAGTLHAQTYGNEWINYNQPHYKFRVFKDSVYRITLAELYAQGLPTNVTGSQFQLFRDGLEEPIFVSAPGALGPADYIEFYGRKADGLIDTAYYKTPSAQLNPNQNLISDTAYYFLTYNNGGSNKRFMLRNNNLNNPPIKEAYCWDKVSFSYRNSFVLS